MTTSVRIPWRGFVLELVAGRRVWTWRVRNSYDMHAASPAKIRVTGTCADEGAALRLAKRAVAWIEKEDAAR